MTAITIAEIQVSKFTDLNKVSTDDLLTYYNEATGKDTKKFASRAKGMQQVWALVEAQKTQAKTAPTKPASTAGETAEKAQAPARKGKAPEDEKPSLKTRVDDLLAFLAKEPKTVAEIAQGLDLPNEKKARSLIDAARRTGHKIACVSRGTFGLAS